MKWLAALTSADVSRLTVEERGRLLTGIVCLMEGISFDADKLTGWAAVTYWKLWEEKQRCERRSEIGRQTGKLGGNPNLVGKGKPKPKAADATEKPAVKRERFIPPTVEEVAAYCASRNNNIDAEEFVARYNSNGWKQANGNAIKDWKAAVITWEKNDKKRKMQGGQKEGVKYGPNGVAIAADRKSDLDDIFQSGW